VDGAGWHPGVIGIVAVALNAGAAPSPPVVTDVPPTAPSETDPHEPPAGPASQSAADAARDGVPAAVAMLTTVGRYLGIAEHRSAATLQARQRRRPLRCRLTWSRHWLASVRALARSGVRATASVPDRELI
jgi:hypothetical protein